jgi:hypothetical protein
MKPSEALTKAAELITPEGAWTQGNYRRPTPDGGVCRCVFGAVGDATDCGVADAEDNYAPWIAAAIGITEGDRSTQIIRWNDAPGRTQAEVVEALRAASELARSEGQ